MPVRVLIVDDHRAFGESLQIAISTRTDMECVGVAGSVPEALELVAAHPPDVVLMDVELPGIDGIEGTRLVLERVPASRVLILTAHAELDLMTRAADAGASGFLAKHARISEVLQAITSAHEGWMLVDGPSLALILDRARGQRQPSRRGPVDLTPREAEVLALMGEGMDVTSIAKALSLSVHTCRGHVKSIL